MNITKIKENDTLILQLEGRMNAVTSPSVDQEIQEAIRDITDLVLDFEKVEYVSSAGLRVLLATHLAMSEKGKMRVINVKPAVQEVFDITKFTNVINIE